MIVAIVCITVFVAIFAASMIALSPKKCERNDDVDKDNEDLRLIIQEMQSDAEYARLTLVLDEVLVDAMTDYDPTSQRYKEIAMIRELIAAYKVYR